MYCKIQKNIIDALDKADYVEVKGMNGNKTDICVNLMKKTNTEKQTVFENCLADVNIPLGEVFTSPVLAKTNGVINVSEVYLNDLKLINPAMFYFSVAAPAVTTPFQCSTAMLSEPKSHRLCSQFFFRTPFTYMHQIAQPVNKYFQYLCGFSKSQ